MKTAGRAEEMKEGSSLPKCLGLLKTRGYKEDNETLLGDLEAMAGYRGHGHGLEEAHMEPCFFFFLPQLCCRLGYSSLSAFLQL